MDFQVTGLEGNQGKGTGAQAGPSVALNLLKGSVPVQSKPSEVANTNNRPPVEGTPNLVKISQQARELSQAAESNNRGNETKGGDNNRSSAESEQPIR